MDEKQFKNLLKQTLDEEIQDVNLWTNLSNQFPAPQTVRAGFRLSRAPLLALLAIMTAAVVYALYQGSVLAGDPGIVELDNANLLTMIDQTNTLEGDYSITHNLTVTLDYAYADANRVTVGYTVRGTSPDGQRMMAYHNATLMTTDGTVLERLFLGANQQNQTAPTEDSAGGFTSRSVSNFIAEDLHITGDPLEFSLIIDVALSQADTGEFPAPGMTMAGVTQFKFIVPAITGKVVEIGQPTTVNDISVELKRVVTTPSMTRLDMCYDLPILEIPPAWSPYIIITIEDEVVFNGKTETYGSEVSYDLNEDCRGVVVPVPLLTTGDWQIEVVEFQDVSPEGNDPITGAWTFKFEVPVAIEE
jgi:hypothetical protein